MASSMPRRFPPSFPVTPPQACAALWYKRRRGARMCAGRWAGCPLRPPLGGTSPKGGGETRLCASFWRRTYLAPPSGPLRPGGTLPSGRSPLPRRSVLDVCHWQTAPEPAGESGLALARTERASCQSHRPLPWLSPLRAHAPRSLVSFLADAHKVKVKTVGLCPTPRKLFEKSLTKNFYARYRSAPLCTCVV